ncbi:O-methylsterigmatocystin oxidoreductase Short=OMST oxidoreductase [Rhizoctonia solani AG-1 IB]|uniref:O-methylsterigmatocystin oxidoreductase Short=OMST oxidoreductase n=1 Tax=Thanatephorus cucumeris (strain AG1-IB / isolate 7/3/14) TaxID=1108050 RepID=M5BMT6_THACB|nr:O-methylsterigmatocystin oxidoreductase Short=OMST oxidoreductase [Rhizoctonia solani AG-1 IB]
MGHPLPPGDVSYVKLLGQDIILLSSYEAAAELLDRKSAIYSSRPSQIMAGELVGWEQGIGLLPYGEEMKRTRRLLYEAMNGKAMSDLYPLQEREIIKFVQGLLRNPNQLKEHIHQMVGSSLIKLTYGYEVEGVNDPFIVLANEAMAMFSVVTAPGAWIVDTLPFLKHIPWTSFKAKAKEWRALLHALVDRPMKFTRDRIWAGASILAAGTDTTASVVATFFALMALHPEVQKRAQTEITQVIGDDRLPKYDDRSSLPYIEAVYREVLRWHAVLPAGLPHLSVATDDDEFRGMRIPKGSVVFAVVQNMHHDPQTYHEPHIFNPERFLGYSRNVERNPESTIFGFGRRRCPGINVARSSVWLAISCVLATYDVGPAVGPDGKPTPPNMKFTNGTISHIEPYECNITPRSAKAVSLIEEAPDVIV